MFYFHSVVLTLWTLVHSNGAEPNSNLKFVNNILQLKHGELHFISDFGHRGQSEFIAGVMEVSMKPISIEDASKISQHDNSSMTRNCTGQPERLKSRLPSLFVVWVGNDLLSRVLLMFASTVSKCARYIDTGNYYRDNAFIFFVEDGIDTAKHLVFNDPLMKRHKNVAIAYKKRNNFIIFNYSFYDNSTKSATIWEANKGFKSVTNIYSNSPMNRFKFVIGTMKDAHRVIADTDPHPKSPLNKLINFAGYEIIMLRALSAKFNFTFEIINPAEFEYGRLNKKGIWTGLPGCIVREKCDIIIGSNTLAGDRTRVLLTSHPIDYDFFTFASPKPLKYLNLFTLLYPLAIEVWMGTIASLILMTFSLYLMMKMMENSLIFELKGWDTLGKLAFNTLGTIVGQDVTRTRKFYLFQSTSLRIAMASWLLSVFIIFAGYAGSLRTFLIAPSYEKPIETYADILRSGMPIDYLDGHNEASTGLAQSEDPIIRELWKKKTTVAIGPHSPTNIVRMGKVYQRKTVALFWNNYMNVIAHSSYSTPSGNPLVHLSKYTPLPVFPESWGFSHLNPWFDRFNIQIMRFIETGMMDRWKVVTLNEMKRNSTVILTIPKESKNRKMVLYDYSGVYVMLCCSYFFCFVVFVCEICFRKVKSKRAVDRNEMPLTIMF